MSAPPGVWEDPAKIARLRSLWAEGLSAAKIAKAMKLTKNAIVGKAHRLNLPSRPSPIKRDPTGSARARRLTREKSEKVATSIVAALVSAPAPAAAPGPVAETPVPDVTKMRAYTPTRSRACCWPLGEPGTASFRFCDDTAEPNRPYCAAHCSLAYVRTKDIREAEMPA